MKTIINYFEKQSWINKYTLTVLAFLIWIVLLDGKYSLVKQYKLNSRIAEMERSQLDYQVKLKRAKEEYQDLISDPEKYAREKYFISKPGEEVYIIE